MAYVVTVLHFAHTFVSHSGLTAWKMSVIFRGKYRSAATEQLYLVLLINQQRWYVSSNEVLSEVLDEEQHPSLIQGAKPAPEERKAGACSLVAREHSPREVNSLYSKSV